MLLKQMLQWEIHEVKRMICNDKESHSIDFDYIDGLDNVLFSKGIKLHDLFEDE